VTFAGGASTGNGCTQLVADTITFNGNANFNNNCTGTGVSTITNLKASIVE
jgi:hypothetical protein